MAMIYGVPLLLGSVGSYFVGNMLEELKTEPQPEAQPQAQSSWFGGPEQPQAESSWFGGPEQQFGGPAQPQPQPQSSWFGGPAQPPQQSSWFGGPPQPAQPYGQPPQQSSWFGGPAQYPQQPQSSWFGNQQQFREDAYREALQQTTKKADAAEKQVREANAAIMTAQRNQDAAALESAQRSRSEAQAELLSVKKEMARQASEVAAKTAEAEKRARAADQMILDARRENDQAALEEAKKARQAAEEEKMTMAKELQELKAAAAKQPVSVATPIVQPPPALPFVQPSPPPVVEPTPATQKTPQTLLDEILGTRTNAAQIEPTEVKEEQAQLTPPPPVVQAQPTATPVEPPAAPVEPTATPVVQAQPTATPVVQAPAVSTPSDSGPLFAKPTPNEQQREQLFAKAKLNPELREKYRPDNDVVAMMRQKAEAAAAEAEAEAAAERFRQAGIPEQNPFEDQREPVELPPPPAEQPQSDGWIPLDINNMGTGVYIMPGLFGAAGATYIPTVYKFFNQPKMKDNINVSDEDKLAKIADAQTSMRTYLESLKGKMAVSTGKAKDDLVSLGKEAVNTFKILLDNFKSEEQTAKRRTQLETRQGKIKRASDKEAAIIESSRQKTSQLSSDLDQMIGQFPDSYQQLTSEPAPAPAPEPAPAPPPRESIFEPGGSGGTRRSHNKRRRSTYRRR